ncbi:hypothetical protein DSECCO2_336370 [anaerobic digester metagenome]
MPFKSKSITGHKPNGTFFANEGTATYYEEMDTFIGVSKGVIFSQRANQGLAVQIDTTHDNCVAPLTNGIAVGTITSRDPDGAIPKSTKTWGNYDPRRVRVELDGDLDRLELADVHASITPGDCLAVDRTDKRKYVKEEDATTNIYALQSKDANEGGFIRVLRKGPSQVAAD